MRHPDLFTESEALEYLHLPADASNTMRGFREKHGLAGHKFGNEFIYHRQDLDRLVIKLCGLGSYRDVADRGPRLRLGGAV